jgi:hypothetical protein
MADEIAHISTFLAAAAGLGTAAYGLVDASKAFWGGVSNFGFGYVRGALKPFSDAAATTGLDMMITLKANWLNGMAKAEQKAAAKALIRLTLTPATAGALATATGVDGARLADIARRVAAGETLRPEDINVLGRFDAVVSALLDAAYERGDQKYRNAAKAIGAAVAIVLALVGGWLLDLKGTQMLQALMVGVIATPLAPVAKDLTTSLSAAVNAVRGIKR